MRSSKLSPHINDIVCRYRDGTSAAALARDYGVTTTTITTALVRLGVLAKRRRGDPLSVTADVRDQIVNRFLGGVQPGAIAKQLGRSKSTVYGVLKDAGVELRGHVEATFDDAALATRTRTIEHAPEPHIWPAEHVVADLLRAKGFTVAHQTSIETGNVDLTLRSCSVAVEVCGRGTYLKYMRTGWLERRIRDLGQRGWHTYVLAAPDAEAMAREGVEDVTLWAEFMRRQPPARRQYRVVWRGAQLLAAGCSDQQHIAFVEPTEYAPDAADARDSRTTVEAQD